MKRKIYKQALSVALAATTAFSGLPVYAEEPVDIELSENQEEQNDTAFNVKADGQSEVQYGVDISSTFQLLIPKKITLIKGDNDYHADYGIKMIKSDIRPTEQVVVSSNSSFDVSRKDSNDVVPVENDMDKNIDAQQTSINFIGQITDRTVTGYVNTTKMLSAGEWSGTTTFNISLEKYDGKTVSVSAKNESGEDINASAKSIEGAKKNELMEYLDSSNLLDDYNMTSDDVSALIEVESDDFEGLADTTFDLTGVANTGEKNSYSPLQS